ncbi:hypothetical protein [Streptomyces mexicanus]|uniref:hypothetical protein n=1 Tax=Streptomyces mexicanus TaxID=178566 RepID=UPI003B0045AB
MGTDKLHVIGDWHAVFPEAGAVTEVKVSHVESEDLGISPGDLVGDVHECGADMTVFRHVETDAR